VTRNLVSLFRPERDTYEIASDRTVGAPLDGVAGTSCASRSRTPFPMRQRSGSPETRETSKVHFYAKLMLAGHLLTAP